MSHRTCISIMMAHIATDLSVVSRSVGRPFGLESYVTFRYPAKTARLIEMPFGMWGQVG